VVIGVLAVYNLYLLIVYLSLVAAFGKTEISAPVSMRYLIPFLLSNTVRRAVFASSGSVSWPNDAVSFPYWDSLRVARFTHMVGDICMLSHRRYDDNSTTGMFLCFLALLIHFYFYFLVCIHYVSYSLMLRFTVSRVFSSHHMAWMFLWNKGIGDILYYIWSAFVKGH